MRIASLQLSLEDGADDGSVRAALQAGKAERRKAGRRVKGEVISAEDLFALQCEHDGLPKPVREGMFALRHGRRWRIDFCWHAYGIAVEIEGLVVRRLAGQMVVMGRHASITGYREDRVKYAYAALEGLTVLSWEQSQVKDRFAVDMTARILEARGWKRPKPTTVPGL